MSIKITGLDAVIKQLEELPNKYLVETMNANLAFTKDAILEHQDEIKKENASVEAVLENNQVIIKGNISEELLKKIQKSISDKRGK